MYNYVGFDRAEAISRNCARRRAEGARTIVTDHSLDNQHVLITGAGTGIGAAIAVACAGAGARVSLVGRRRDPLVALQTSLGQARAHVVADFDVTDENKVRAGVA